MPRRKYVATKVLDGLACRKFLALGYLELMLLTYIVAATMEL